MSGRRYAVADLHGELNLYRQIKNFLKPDDIVYCLGDTTDRGPNPWQTFVRVYSDPQWELLCGNHEDMLANAIIEQEEGGSDAYYDLMSNGGVNTFDGWLRAGSNTEWARKIKQLPTIKKITNEQGFDIYLSHAGFTPRLDENGKMVIPIRKQLLWGRAHMEDLWDYRNFPATLIVHGHTPICCQLYTDQEKIDAWNDYGAYYYCGDRKINLDNGSCWTRTTVLLDLDSFDEYIFTI